jgi:rRNA small subunit pseudouridine methyltransferase Nep1
MADDLSDTRKRIHNNYSENEDSHKPQKIPKTLVEKDNQKRLIIILEKANLETIKIGQNFELLNSDKHKPQLAKYGREMTSGRPDITHQCLMMLLDSPLNRAGHLQLYIHTERNVLIEVHPQTRIPRTFDRFCGLIGIIRASVMIILE